MDLTVFSITNGRSTHSHSLKSISTSGDVEVVVVKNMRWMEALSLCLASCKTPYFLRVDDDMILHSQAVTYIQHVLPQTENFGILYWMLWETFTDRVRESIKVYSVEALKRIGGFHADPKTGKVDRVTNPMLESAGFPVIPDPSVLALHICGTWEEQETYEQFWSSMAIAPYHKPNRKAVRSYCGTKSLQEQCTMRGEFLESLNRKRQTPFSTFLESV